MRVVLFFILLFSSADLFAQNPQINPSADTKDMTITIHCPRLQNYSLSATPKPDAGTKHESNSGEF